VLGLVLFLIFINDIVGIFGSGLTVKLFADDVKKMMPLSMMSMTMFFCKKDLMHFMHGQTFGNWLFHYKNALFYILVGKTLTITIQ